ncbi:hypothetical protein V3N99_09945 [Dermatophilaceae bacterium Soc4.6]
MAQALRITTRARRLVVATVVLLGATGTGSVCGATLRHPVTSVQGLAEQAEGRGNVVCARPAAPDVTGAMSVSCVNALGDPVTLLYSSDAKILGAARLVLVRSGWSVAGSGRVLVGVRGALAPSMAAGIAGTLG